MKKFLPHVLVFPVITVWGISAWAYIGVEDGSSGFSSLGWISAAFFLPGTSLIACINGSISESDLLLMAGISWLLYSLVLLGITQAGCMLYKKWTP